MLKWTVMESISKYRINKGKKFAQPIYLDLVGFDKISEVGMQIMLHLHMLKVDELRKLQMFEIVPVTLSALTDIFSRMRNYLQEDLRIDFSAVETWDTTIVEECIKYGRKNKELNYLLRIIKDQ